jgi:hypothetical protein
MNVLKPLLFACALSVLLSTTASADEATEKKVQGVRKAIDRCIEFLEKRDFEGFVGKATHPSIVKDIKKTDEIFKKCIEGHKRHVDEILTAMKAAKKMEPVFLKSADPKEEKALFIFEKSVFKDRDVLLMQFRERDGVWYFLD